MASLNQIYDTVNIATLYYNSQLALKLIQMQKGINTVYELTPLKRLILALQYQLNAQVNDDDTTILYRCLQRILNGYTATYAIDPTVVFPFPPDITLFPRYTGIYPIIVDNTNYQISIDLSAINQGYANVMDYGAVGDTEFGFNGNIADNSNIFTCSLANFSQSYKNKAITIALAQDAGSGRVVELITTITAVNSSTELVLANNATVTAVNVPFNVGTDDTEAIQKAFTQTGVTNKKNVLFPSGKIFKITDEITNNVSYRNIVADGATIVRNSNHIAINSSFCNNWIIQGGRWYCPYANLDAHDTGLGDVTFRTNRCNDVAYQFLTIDGSPEGGIGSTRCVGIRAEGNIIKNLYRDGIYTDYSVKLKYINNTLSNIKDDAISIHDYGAGDIGYPNGGYISFEQELQTDGTTDVTFSSGTWSSNVFTPGTPAPVAIQMTCIFSNNVQEVITFPQGNTTYMVNGYVNDPELFRILSISPSSYLGVPFSFKGKNRVAIRTELLNAGYTQGGQDSLVQGNTVTHSYEGFSSIGGKGIIVTGNVFENTYHCAVKFHNILGNGDYPFFTIDDYLRDIIISNNWCYRNQWSTYINGVLYVEDDSFRGDARAAIMIYTAGSNHEIIPTSSPCKSERVKVFGNNIIEPYTNAFEGNNIRRLVLTNNYAENANGINGDGNLLSSDDIETIGNTFELIQCVDLEMSGNQAMDYRVDGMGDPAPQQARGVLIGQGTGYLDNMTVNYWKESSAKNGIYKFGNLVISHTPALITDPYMIQYILAGSYLESNNYTATITVSSGRKPLQAGFFYKLSEFYYQAVATNLVMRQALTENSDDLPDGVLSGFITTENGTEDGVIVSGGSYRYDGVVYTVNTPTNLAVDPVTNPDVGRFDLVYGDPVTPGIFLLKGTESVDGETPVPPDTPAGCVAFAWVYVTDDGITVTNLNPVISPSLPAIQIDVPIGSTNPVVVDMATNYPQYASNVSTQVFLVTGATVQEQFIAPVRSFDVDEVLQDLTFDFGGIDPTDQHYIIVIKP